MIFIIITFLFQSKDKTVFFFAVDDKYDPIGFITVPGPVRELQWSPLSHVRGYFFIVLAVYVFTMYRSALLNAKLNLYQRTEGTF